MHAVITATARSREEADRIASALVDSRLAACVQLLPIESRYVWKGDVAVDDEVLLLIKTRVDRFDAVRSVIAELHSYEVPEIVLFEVAQGSPSYLAWIDEVVDS